MSLPRFKKVAQSFPTLLLREVEKEHFSTSGSERMCQCGNLLENLLHHHHRCRGHHHCHQCHDHQQRHKVLIMIINWADVPGWELLGAAAWMLLGHLGQTETKNGPALNFLQILNLLNLNIVISVFYDQGSRFLGPFGFGFLFYYLTLYRVFQKEWQK